MACDDRISTILQGIVQDVRNMHIEDVEDVKSVVDGWAEWSVKASTSQACKFPIRDMPREVVVGLSKAFLVPFAEVLGIIIDASNNSCDSPESEEFHDVALEVTPEDGAHEVTDVRTRMALAAEVAADLKSASVNRVFERALKLVDAGYPDGGRDIVTRLLESRQNGRRAVSGTALLAIVSDLMECTPWPVTVSPALRALVARHRQGSVKSLVDEQVTLVVAALVDFVFP